ncbi:hypothetical protein ACXM0N_14135 [Peribacillus simplex]
MILDDSEFSMERTATNGFKKDSTGTLRCIIDNSYDAELIELVKAAVFGGFSL